MVCEKILLLSYLIIFWMESTVKISEQVKVSPCINAFFIVNFYYLKIQRKVLFTKSIYSICKFEIVYLLMKIEQTNIYKIVCRLNVEKLCLVNVYSSDSMIIGIINFASLSQLFVFSGLCSTGVDRNCIKITTLHLKLCYEGLYLVFRTRCIPELLKPG